MNNRPIDVLEESKSKKILIRLKNHTQVGGELQAFDMHLNMWLNNAEIIEEDKKETYKRLLVRGDNVVFISPSNN